MAQEEGARQSHPTREKVRPESHQKVCKSRKARLLEDVQTKASEGFPSGNQRLSMPSCSKEGHENQTLSIYCNECQRFLCGICVSLDLAHAGKFQDAAEDIQKKREEVQQMRELLKKKKKSYATTHTKLQEQPKKAEEMNKKIQGQIHEKVEEIVQVLRKKEKQFLAETEYQYNQQVQDVNMKLQAVDNTLRTLASLEKMVERMGCCASGHAFLEMHSSIQESLEDLKQRQPPAVDLQIQEQYLAEATRELQALHERVTEDKGLLQLGGASLTTDGLRGLPTEEPQHALMYPSPLQVSPSTSGEGLLSESPPPMDLSTAAWSKLVLTPEGTHFGQEEVHTEEDPHMELIPSSVGSNAEDIPPGSHGATLLPKSSESSGSYEERSEATTVNMMEEEEEQQDQVSFREGVVGFQEPLREAEGHQELEPRGDHSLPLFPHAQSAQHPELLHQSLSSFWAPGAQGSLEGSCTWKESFHQTLCALQGDVSALANQKLNVAAAMVGIRNDVKGDFQKVHERMDHLCSLMNDMKNEMVAIRAEIDQLSIMIQEFVSSIEICAGGS